MNTRQPSLPGESVLLKNSPEIKDDESLLPKLRKNRKIELRWGQKYCAALKELVFTLKPSSYIPAGVPDKLKIDNVPETLYVCKQCNDSFRIKASLDDHINRKSWILGYWCNYCFRPNCSHTKEESTMCLPCQNIENKNRARLSRRGLKRGQKMGAVQVFYNQCQYFSHLKSHNISTVDMASIMLMPLPPEVEISQFDQLHETCKAIMEHAFVKQKHIVDFLRTESSNTKWWMSTASDESSIGELLRKYYIDSCDEFSDNCDSSDRENSSNPNKNSTINSDITFVDCGPTAKSFVSSEIKIGSPLITKVATSSSIISTSIGALPSKSHIPNVKPTTSFFADVPSLASLKKHHSTLKITSKGLSSFTNDNKINKNIMQTFNKPSTSQAHAPEEANNHNNNDYDGDKISAIVAPFPSKLIKNNKIMMINKDREKTFGDHDSRMEATEENLTTSIDSTIMSSSIAGLGSLLSTLPNSQKKSNQLTLDGKLVIQNGKKFIIKQIPALNSTDKVKAIPGKINLVPLTVNATNSLQTKNEASTLKQSATNIEFCQSKKITGDNSEVIQNTTFNFKKAGNSLLLSPKIENGKLYVSKSPVNSESQQLINVKSLKSHATNVDTLIKQYQFKITKNLQHYSKRRIQKIIDHLKQVCRNCSASKFADSDRIVATNFKILKKYENYLENSAQSEETKDQEESINEKFHRRKKNWEFEKTLFLRCQKCKKKLKPKNYMIGISNAAVEEEKYCHCYNYICHLCNSRQGNPQRYKAHLRFHETEAPYTCPDCSRVFSTMQNLEIHIWTKCFHIMSQQIFSCRVCEIEGFLTMEELTRHYYEIHSRSALLCPDCQRVLSSYSEYLMHHSENHQSTSKSPEPEALIICDFGGCLILPESFRYHMESHAEIGKVIYYTCPFCKFFVRNISGNEGIIQDHVFKNHKDRLCEVITPESLNLFKTKFNLNFDNKSNNYKNTASGGKMIVPRIVNACSIPSLTFEQTSEKPGYQVQCSNSGIPKIVSVRSVKTTTTSATSVSSSTIPNGVTIPKIVNVQSMNPTANSKMIYVMPSKNAGDVNSQKQSSKADDIPMNPNKNRVMVKLNLVNGNSSQLGDKKLVIYKSISKTPNTSNNTLSAMSSIKYAATSPLTTVSYSKTSYTTFTSTPASSTTHTTSTYTPISTVASKSKQNPLAPSIKQQLNHSIEIKSNYQSEKVSGIDGNNHDKLESSISNSLYKEKNLKKDEENEKEGREIQQEEEEEEEEKGEEEKEEKDEEDINCELLEKKMKLWDAAKDWKQSTTCSKRRGRPKKPWRIALNPPENSQPCNFKCHLCSENITTSWEVIKHHFASRHYREYRLCTITPKLQKMNDIERIEIKAECKKRKLPLSSSPGSRRKRKFCGSKIAEDNSSNTGICVTQEKLEEVEGNIKCKKCGELFKEINLLREHVANKHRIKGHFLICLECGENFVVANSLQMHLKAFHGIIDPIMYLAKNSLYAPAIGGFSDKRTIEPNQCYVCMAVFEDKSAVDKHLRVHGMAFLNHTRIEARNALKIDDKKNEANNTPDEEQKSQSNPVNNEGNDASILTRISKLLS